MDTWTKPDRRRQMSRPRSASKPLAYLPVLTPRLSALGRKALDLLLPPTCLGCRTVVDAAGALCPDCWRAVSFLAPPWCESCGLPFEIPEPEGTICGACARTRPAYDRARAALGYDDGSRKMLLSFKHADRLNAAPVFARWMAAAAGDLLADADILVPVPLHRWRLAARRYNQAGLLAQRLGTLAERPVAPDALIRHRATPSQGHLAPHERARNVRGAFAVPPRRRHHVEGRRVLLIDDVITTGATGQACTAALRAAGAMAVDLLTVARVVRPAPW